MLKQLNADLYKNRKCYTMMDALNGATGDGIGISNIMERAKTNAFLQAMTKANHTLQSSDAGAIGEMSNLVIAAAQPSAIGREACVVVDTKKPSVKFRKAKRAYAEDSAQSRTTESIGERNDFVEILCNIETEVSEEWTLNFLEDAEWDILSAESAAIGKALAVKETQKIFTLLGTIADADLAGGAVPALATANKLSYDDLVSMWGMVKSADRNPTKCFINPIQAADLWKDSKFIDSMFFGEFVDKARGVFGRSILGFDIIVSSLVADGTAWMIDNTVSVGMPIRREALLIPYEGTQGKTHAGVKATNRYGLGILDTKGVSKVTGAT